MPDDAFYEKRLQKTAQGSSMMNIGRHALKLSADSRPATEAAFISCRSWTFLSCREGARISYCFRLTLLGRIII